MIMDDCRMVGRLRDNIDGPRSTLTNWRRQTRNIRRVPLLACAVLPISSSTAFTFFDH